MPGLLVPGANSEPGPCPGGGHSVSLFYHLFYSISPLPSEGLIFSDEMASPGNAGPGNGILMNPLGQYPGLISLYNPLTKLAWRP